MNIAVVGAGMAGLAAARTLTAAGATAVVFEKSRGPGGRIATRRLNGIPLDTGATSVTPRGMALEPVMLSELDQAGLEVIGKPIHVHNGLRVSAGDPHKNAVVRYAYADGINTLAKRLAQGLDIRTEVQIDELARDGKGFVVADGRYDGVILTAPIPQTATLLWSLGERRAIASARYRPCLSVLLAFEYALPSLPYFALLDPDQRHPLTWLSVESQKVPGRAPDGQCAFVAQMSSPYSQSFYNRPGQEVVDDVVGFLHRLYGAELGSPVAQDVKRWKYSQPESIALFEHVNPPGQRLLIAGDGTSGGRIENAYEAGVRAARQMLETV